MFFVCQLILILKQLECDRFYDNLKMLLEVKMTPYSIAIKTLTFPGSNKVYYLALKTNNEYQNKNN